MVFSFFVFTPIRHTRAHTHKNYGQPQPHRKQIVSTTAILAIHSFTSLSPSWRFHKFSHLVVFVIYRIWAYFIVAYTSITYFIYCLCECNMYTKWNCVYTNNDDDDDDDIVYPFVRPPNFYSRILGYSRQSTRIKRFCLYVCTTFWMATFVLYLTVRWLRFLHLDFGSPWIFIYCVII